MVLMVAEIPTININIHVHSIVVTTALNATVIVDKKHICDLFDGTLSKLPKMNMNLILN